MENFTREELNKALNIIESYYKVNHEAILRQAIEIKVLELDSLLSEYKHVKDVNNQSLPPVYERLDNACRDLLEF